MVSVLGDEDLNLLLQYTSELNTELELRLPPAASRPFFDDRQPNGKPKESVLTDIEAGERYAGFAAFALYAIRAEPLIARRHRRRVSERPSAN